MRRGLGVGIAQHKNVLFPASTYFSEIARSTLSSKFNGDSTVTEDTKWRRVQRVGLGDAYYPYKTGIFDTVFIRKEIRGTHINDTPHKTDCRFGMILRFVKIDNPKMFRNQCTHHAKNCIQCHRKSGDAVCFVKWLKVIGNIWLKLIQLKRNWIV